MTTNARRKADAHRFALANGVNYTTALRQIDEGYRYPMDRAAERYYRNGSIAGPEDQRHLRSRLDLVTDPRTTPEELHEHLVRGARDIDVRDTAALRPDLLTETIDFLLREQVTQLAALARQQNASSKALHKIANNSQVSNETLIGMLTHPSADEKLLKKLSKIVARPDVRAAARAVLADTSATG